MRNLYNFFCVWGEEGEGGRTNDVGLMVESETLCGSLRVGNLSARFVSFQLAAIKRLVAFDAFAMEDAREDSLKFTSPDAAA